VLFADLVIHEAPAYSAGWFTLALINAGLAQSKNRSGLLWFVLSIFLGPIATFILVVFCGKVPDSDLYAPPRV
jgi:hypothetical protein